MTKEEFMALAAKQWGEIEKLRKEETFYDYEKKFDEQHIAFGREILEGELGSKSLDRRVKKKPKPDME